MTLVLYPRGAAFTANPEVLRQNEAFAARPIQGFSPGVSPYAVPAATMSTHYTAGALGLTGFTRATWSAAIPAGAIVQYKQPFLDGPTGANPWHVSAYVRPSISRNVRPVLPVTFEDGFEFHATGPQVLARAGQWTRVDIQLLDAFPGVPVSALGVGVEIMQAQAAGFTLDITCILIENVARLDAYFDGQAPQPYPYAASYQYGVGVSPSQLRAGTYLGEVRPHMLTEYEEETETRHTALDIIGRRDPIPVVSAGGLRRGRLVAFCPSHTDALAVAAMLNAGITAFRDTDLPTRDMDLIAPQVGVQQHRDTKAPVFVVTVSYIEVKRP